MRSEEFIQIETPDGHVLMVKDSAIVAISGPVGHRTETLVYVAGLKFPLETTSPVAQILKWLDE